MERRTRKKEKVASKGLGKTPLVREFSAGGVVFKKNKDGSVSWLIINPKDTKRWQLPKGHIDKGESSEVAALREVREEGGLEARLLKKIGNERLFFYFQGKRIFKTVTFYLMEFTKDTKEGFSELEVGETQFLSFKKATELLTFKNDKEILQKGYDFLNRGLQGNLI